MTAMPRSGVARKLWGSPVMDHPLPNAGDLQKQPDHRIRITPLHKLF